VKIAYRAAVDFASKNEVGLMRINNYREQKIEEVVDPLAQEPAPSQ
jgi:hypothetical protein